MNKIETKVSGFTSCTEGVCRFTSCTDKASVKLQIWIDGLATDTVFADSTLCLKHMREYLDIQLEPPKAE